MPKLASNASMSAETAGDEIHRKREDEGIEEETEDAVRQHHPAHGPRRHLHVGDLARHADDIGEIEKIPIVRQFVAGKFEAAAILSSLARRVVAVNDDSNAARTRYEPWSTTREWSAPPTRVVPRVRYRSRVPP